VKLFRLAKEYQRLDGFSDLPPPPGQIVIPINNDSDTDDEYLLYSETDCSDDSDDDMDEDENSGVESPIITPQRLQF